MIPKPTKGYVMPVKQGPYEVALSDCKQSLLKLGLSDDTASMLVTALIQGKVAKTSIDTSRATYLVEQPKNIRHRGPKTY